MEASSSQQRKVRASPPSCKCAAHYQEVIDALTQELAAAQEKIAELTAERDTRVLLPTTPHAGDHPETQLERALASLTKREREVAQLFLQFANDKRVASHLGIAIQTVRNQVASIQKKLRVDSREKLILLLTASPGDRT